MTARAVAETLGGKKVLKRQVRSDLDLLGRDPAGPANERGRGGAAVGPL